MVYRGQIIFSFDTERDDQILKEHAKQFNRFSSFIFAFFVIFLLGFLILDFDQLSSTDYFVVLLILVILGGVYYRINRRMKALENEELILLDESLTIYEYGIDFPPLTNPSIDPLDDEYRLSEHIFLTYNQIDNIAISDNNINFKTVEGEFIVNLLYFPFSHIEYEQEGLLEFFVELIQLIKSNISKIENKDHPTIIPKAYFRDILP